MEDQNTSELTMAGNQDEESHLALVTTSSTQLVSATLRPNPVDEGDEPPNKQPLRRGDIFQNELQAKTSNDDSHNSYENQIVQEFEAHRQDYLLNNSIKMPSSQLSRRTRYCQMACILLLTFVSLTIAYGVLHHKKTMSARRAGTPLGFANATQLEPPPDDITFFCTKSNIETPLGLEKCLELCKPSACCHYSYLETGSCWIDNSAVCHAYEQVCSVLNPKSTSAPTSPSQLTVFPNAVVLWESPDLLPPAPDYLSETCHAMALLQGEYQSEETSGAAQTCQEICNKARCCWDTSLEKAADRCWTHPNCPHYTDACSALNENPKQQDAGEGFSGGFALSVPQAPAKISSFCHSNKIENNLTDLLACQQACLSSECCWNSALLDVERCTYDPQCPNYIDTCSILNEPFYPPSSDNVTAATTANATKEYSPEVIWDVCYNHDNNINTGQPSLCEKVCQPATCCYDLNSTACPTTYPSDFCDKYHPCQALVDDSHTPEAYVQRACSNLEDLSECVKKCSTSTCCFTTDASKACASTHPDIKCSVYTACEILYKNSTNNLPQGTSRNAANQNAT